MDRDQTAIRVYSNNQSTEPERVPIPQKVLTTKEAAKARRGPHRIILQETRQVAGHTIC